MKVLSVAPDGTYAYGTSLPNAIQNLKNLGGDAVCANHYQVADTHTTGKVTVEAILIQEPKIKHI